ncbi:MAG TPA: tRNA 2-thiouridine(34) synthase MnmA [Bryobacteraceae bacterium]|jgi:tRNA-specific 2-thiouridylase|nr:tRNA 2-thiouridine(34) synthase MnmA [Bryobacteraceae bacterium]
MSKAETIAVAMSGGVDSSVVAGLLQRKGDRVIGLTMQLWNQRRLPKIAPSGPTGRCCSIDDVYDARHVAQHLGIPYYVVNFEDRFEQQVVKPFVDEYLAGRTPIPCTLCNNFIKFDQFLEMADGVGASRIATGHYARIAWNQDTGRWEMRRSADRSKDQTYFLFGLTQEQLARTQFPLGGYEKPQVRELARELGIPTAEKPDSQEICFVPNGDYAAFIDAYFREQGIGAEDTRGELVTTDGRVVGEHSGVHHFTVGQRRGIGIAAGEPLYVIATEPITRRVVIGRNDALLRATMHVKDVNWISIAPPATPIRGEIKIRNKHAAAAATITPNTLTRVEVHFDEPQRAVTPGQGAVFYSGDLVLGGGWIE